MKELIDIAPLGLDFERPEEVWVPLRAGHPMVELDCDLIQAFLSEADALAYLRMDPGHTDKDAITAHAEFVPEKMTPEQTVQWPYSKGFVILDREGELVRQVWLL